MNTKQSVTVAMLVIIVSSLVDSRNLFAAKPDGGQPIWIEGQEIG